MSTALSALSANDPAAFAHRGDPAAPAAHRGAEPAILPPAVILPREAAWLDPPPLDVAASAPATQNPPAGPAGESRPPRLPQLA